MTHPLPAKRVLEAQPGAAERKVRRSRRNGAPKAARREACLSEIGMLDTHAKAVRRTWASRPCDTLARAWCVHWPASLCAADRIRPEQQNRHRTASDARAQAPASRRMALRARSQAPVQRYRMPCRKRCRHAVRGKHKFLHSCRSTAARAELPGTVAARRGANVRGR